MYLSKYFHSIKRENSKYYAVYNALIMNVLYVNKQELDAIISVDESSPIDFRQTLIDNGIWVKNLDIDDRALSLLRHEYLESQKKIELLYIGITQGCNLGCKYCFLENEYANWRPKIMSETIANEVVTKYIDYVKRKNIYKPQIIFFGGEPLLNWKVLKHIVSLCEPYNSEVDTDSRISFSIVTNGTLITDEIASFLVEHNIGIGLSIDGPKKINDKNRVFKSNGQSVYNRILQSIEVLKKHGCSFGLSMTMSPEFIKHKEEIIPWLKKMNVGNIFTNFYQHSEYHDWWKIHSIESARFITDSFEELANLGIINGRPARQIECLISGKMKFSDCAGVGLNQFLIKPDGEVRVCQCDYRSDDNHIGYISDGSIEEIMEKANSLKRWLNRTPIMREECKSCEALFCCGGGCLTQSKILFGDGNVDESYCTYVKHMLNWFINYNFSQQNEGGD